MPQASTTPKPLQFRIGQTIIQKATNWPARVIATNREYVTIRCDFAHHSDLRFHSRPYLREHYRAD